MSIILWFGNLQYSNFNENLNSYKKNQRKQKSETETTPLFSFVFIFWHHFQAFSQKTSSPLENEFEAVLYSYFLII